MKCFRVCAAASLLASMLFLSIACGNQSQSSRDVAGTRVESNLPKTEQFVKKADAIKPGTTITTVRSELGRPDEIRHGVVQEQPNPDAAEELIDKAPAGTRFEHWVYKRGDSHFHVFFTRAGQGGQDDWRVLTVRSTPKNAVGK